MVARSMEGPSFRDVEREEIIVAIAFDTERLKAWRDSRYVSISWGRGKSS